MSVLMIICNHRWQSMKTENIFRQDRVLKVYVFRMNVCNHRWQQIKTEYTFLQDRVLKVYVCFNKYIYNQVMKYFTADKK